MLEHMDNLHLLAFKNNARQFMKYFQASFKHRDIPIKVNKCNAMDFNEPNDTFPLIIETSIVSNWNENTQPRRKNQMEMFHVETGLWTFKNDFDIFVHRLSQCRAFLLSSIRDDIWGYPPKNKLIITTYVHIHHTGGIIFNTFIVVAVSIEQEKISFWASKLDITFAALAELSNRVLW